MAYDSYNTIMIDCETTRTRVGTAPSGYVLLPGMIINFNGASAPGLSYFGIWPNDVNPVRPSLGIVVENVDAGQYTTDPMLPIIDTPYAEGSENVYIKFPHVGDILLARLGGDNPVGSTIQAGKALALATLPGPGGYLEPAVNGTYMMCQSRYAIAAGTVTPIVIEVVWTGVHYLPIP